MFSGNNQVLSRLYFHPASSSWIVPEWCICLQTRMDLFSGTLNKSEWTAILFSSSSRLNIRPFSFSMITSQPFPPLFHHFTPFQPPTPSPCSPASTGFFWSALVVSDNADSTNYWLAWRDMSSWNMKQEGETKYPISACVITCCHCIVTLQKRLKFSYGIWVFS